MRADIDNGNMAGKTKVLYIITGLATGGAERALYNLLNGGLADHFDNHLISLSDEGTIGSLIRELGVPVTALNMRSGLPSLSGLVKLHRVVREFRPDLIQGWMYHGNIVATLARALAPGRPVLLWNVRQSLYSLSNEKFVTQQVIRLNKLFSSHVSALLYNSKLSKKQHEKYGFSSSKGLVIPNGIDMKKFSYSSKSSRKIRSELGISDGALVVGLVARLHPMKDHKLFLKVATEIAHRNLNTHFLLSGLNVTVNNQYFEKLIPVKVSNRFHLLGERDDVPELMCAMDILCLCSAWGEGFPNVIGEAMAVGLPCVTTDVGDSAFLVGECGVVCPPKDEAALGVAIKTLLMLSDEQRSKLGKKAHERVKQNFSLGSIVRNYVDLYRNLV